MLQYGDKIWWYFQFPSKNVFLTISQNSVESIEMNQWNLICRSQPLARVSRRRCACMRLAHASHMPAAAASEGLMWPAAWGEDVDCGGQQGALPRRRREGAAQTRGLLDVCPVDSATRGSILSHWMWGSRLAGLRRVWRGPADARQLVSGVWAAWSGRGRSFPFCALFLIRSFGQEAPVTAALFNYFFLHCSDNTRGASWVSGFPGQFSDRCENGFFSDAVFLCG